MSNRISYLLKLLESTPNDSFLLFALAKEYENGGDDVQAGAYYNRLKASDPNYTGLYYHLGKLYERQGNIPEAATTYKQGIEVCRITGDRHAMSELQGALLNIEDPE